ncbi:hypothetical protein DPMN_055564 [Dreissena polymorpha]|uniref:Uncharacterized protein n=1 Tax=Dreissena polymorpha TaxID=45954 RepID=A0A9D4CS30_DREPO|nr:hypothetical protein DPMN_055564 [Dreissena polymorpha]
MEKPCRASLIGSVCRQIGPTDNTRGIPRTFFSMYRNLQKSHMSLLLGKLALMHVQSAQANEEQYFLLLLNFFVKTKSLLKENPVKVESFVPE